jgi:hypothetical protein
MRKEISKKVKETEDALITTTVWEHTCYCCEGGDTNNCNCYDKRRNLAWDEDCKYQELGKKVGFGPCLPCRGTRLCRYSRVEKHSKSLCVGGPLDKQKVVSAPGYDPFNRATRYGRADKGPVPPKTILVHESYWK